MEDEIPVQPIDYNFAMDYVNLLDVNFSQDTISISNKPNTLDKIRCMNNNINLVFSPIHETILEDNFHCDIYVLGFFGKEMLKDDIKYMYPPQIPLIEVIDVNTEHLSNPYVTINNRRLYQIYLLLYSIANIILNENGKIDELFIDAKYINDINGVNIFTLVDIFKRRLSMLGIIVREIYIPVIINKISAIAPDYLFPPSIASHTWGSFLEERIRRQNLFCKTNTTKENPCPRDMILDNFVNGSPIIPYFGTKKGYYYTEPPEYRKPIDPIKLSFVSSDSSDYLRLLNIFELTNDKQNSTIGKVERTVVKTLINPQKGIVLKKLKVFTDIINMITTCYHRPINNTDTYLAKITPINVEQNIPLHELQKKHLSGGKRGTKRKTHKPRKTTRRLKHKSTRIL